MCSSKTDQCPGRDIEHGLTVRPLACLTAGSCRRRPAKNALSKQRPRRKPRVGRFRTPGRNGSKVHSAGLNCLDLHVFFLHRGGLFSDPSNSHCVDLQELPDSLRPPGAKDIAEASPKKEHRPETSN